MKQTHSSFLSEMFVVILVAVGSSCLVGCQSVSQQLEARNDLAREYTRKAKLDCETALWDPTLAPLRGRARLCDPKETPAKMLDQSVMISPEEKALFPLLVSYLNQYFDKELEFSKKYDGTAVTVLNIQYHNAVRSIIAELYNEQITWGQFNQRVLAIYNEFDERLQVAGNAYWSSRKRAEQARSAAMASFGAALQNYGNTVYGPAATQQQMLKGGSSSTYMYQPPKATDCQAFGNRVSCTTQGGATLGGDGLYSPPKTTNCQFYGNRMSCTEN